MFANLALSVHYWIGNTPFVLLSLIPVILLCWKAIPYFTDRMVNAASGLAGRYLGKDQRVLMINASTNNPELASMLVALSLGRRPELFSDIDDSQENPSWANFWAGTVGLVLSCFVINSLFIAWTVIYGEALSSLVGPAIFAGLHYVVGVFVTSLPEVVVAVENYEKLTSPDLNTAFSSATQSNMTNLAIALIGSLLGALFLHIQLIQEI